MSEDFSAPIRWILGEGDNCEACKYLAGEYPIRAEFGRKAQGTEPGYFPIFARRNELVKDSRLVACDTACTCKLEVLTGGEWVAWREATNRWYREQG